MSPRLVRRIKVRWALAGSAAAVPYRVRYLAWLCQAHEMMDFSGTQVRKLINGSRLPFHSSCRVTALRRVRQATCRITVRFGRSSQTTVSARAQTIGRTTL
jgi:hypothetical protein